MGEVDVDEHDVRAKLLLESKSFGARRCNPDYRYAFALEQQARAVEEGLIVVDDKAADLHLSVS